MRRWLTVFAASTSIFAVLACSGLTPPLPAEVVLAAAEPLSALGHPMAQYTDAEVVGWNNASLTSSGSHDAWVDLDVHYDRRGTAHTMRVRFYVHSMDPCKITTDVLDDDGPPPILLDNALSSKAVGERMCEEMAAAMAGG